MFAWLYVPKKDSVQPWHMPLLETQVIYLVLSIPSNPCMMHFVSLHPGVNKMLHPWATEDEFGRALAHLCLIKSFELMFYGRCTSFCSSSRSVTNRKTATYFIHFEIE